MWTPVEVWALATLAAGAAGSSDSSEPNPELEGGAQPEVIEVQGDSVLKERPPEAATRIDMSQYELESADLGQILNRQQGITVRRTGGLGSDVRLTLNGLSGNQVRFFVDGVPLELAGFGTRIADIPPSLLEGITIYRGVVPSRLGADALGGAIELETGGAVEETELSASYLVGSFGTQRASVSASSPIDDDGLFINVSGFFDDTDNDFESEQRVNDPETGAVDQRLVRRFHDAYRGLGVSAVAGWVDHRELGTLTLRGFFSRNEKEVQQGASSFTGNAFGEAERTASTFGALARFDVELAHAIRLFGAAGGARVRNELFDISTCAYSWLGECGPVVQVPGEIGDASDSTQDSDSFYLRASLEAELAEDHLVRLSVSPTVTRLRGEERAGDLVVGAGLTGTGIEAQRDLFTSVFGLEYELSALDGRVDAVVFGKWYRLDGESEGFDVLDADLVDLSSSELGAGAVVRVALVDPLSLEASFEYALRLPTPTEFFGVPGVIFPNLELLPERGNNANLGVKLQPWKTEVGVLRSEVNGFLRDSTDLIRLVSFLEFLQFANVASARSAGVESSFSWTSPGQYFGIDASVTLMDFVNTSDSGEEAAFNGDRVPNTPYRFGSITARFQLSELIAEQDSLVLAWTTRFVDRFFLTWESIGREDTKIDIDSQLENSANVGYRFSALGQRVAIAFDAQNLTNESLFDFFGIQRPGRAFFFRMNVDVSSL